MYQRGGAVKVSNLKGCYSHLSDHWRTPSEIYNYFINNDYIDPCPFMADFDGLQIEYKNKKIFINPPYSKMKEWTAYALKLLGGGCKIVLLIPARTETKYFHELLKYNPKILFFSGRLHFNNSKNSAPFPSVLIILEQGRKTREWGTIHTLDDIKEGGC